MANDRQGAGKTKGQQVFAPTKGHHRHAKHWQLASAINQQRTLETIRRYWQKG